MNDAILDETGLTVQAAAHSKKHLPAEISAQKTHYITLRFTAVRSDVTLGSAQNSLSNLL